MCRKHHIITFCEEVEKLAIWRLARLEFGGLGLGVGQEANPPKWGYVVSWYGGGSIEIGLGLTPTLVYIGATLVAELRGFGGLALPTNSVFKQ